MSVRTRPLFALLLCAAVPCSAKAQIPHIIGGLGGGQSRRVESPVLKKALEKTVSFPGIEDRKTTLLKVLDSLAQTYNVSFDVAERAFKAEGVEAVLKTHVAEDNPVPPMKATLATVLRKILVCLPVPSGAVLVVRRDTIEITTGAAWRRELGLPLNADTTPLVSVRLRKVPVRKALADLADEWGLPLLIDLRLGDKPGVPVTASLDHVPRAAALELLADMGELGLVQKGGICYVTSPANAARLKKEAGCAKLDRDWPGNWTPVSLRKNLTLRQALEAVSEDTGVNVLIDARVEGKLRARIGDQVTRLRIVEIESTLELLADMANLTVVKKTNVYYVTSLANAARLKKAERPE